MVKENLEAVRKIIEQACGKIGTEVDSVSLIAVSKTFAVDEIEEAILAGQTVFGENKVQEFKSKKEYFDSLGRNGLQWHLIGPLQKNKAKVVARYADLFHCLDSLKLAEKLDRCCAAENRILPVLIQINSSGESSKGGIDPDQLPSFIASLSVFPNLKISGLMSIGRFHANAEESRAEFQMMKKLYDTICNGSSQENCEFSFLSMGMSNDFHIAIEEGANLVRVGSRIFGGRFYGA